jgi:hypothetical protein
MRQPPIPSQVKFQDVSMCFGHFGKFQCVSAGTYISAGLLFWVFFFFSALLLLRPFFFFFFFFFLFPLSSLSLTFLYFLSFVFLPKRRRNGFWFKCRAPLPSSFFFFFPPNSLSLCTFSLLFFCLFGSSAGLYMMLLDICLKFLFHLHFGVLCTLFFILFK